MALTIYLDVCCLNRPFDDQNQPRIRLEAESILSILALVQQKTIEWVGSEVLTVEISRTPDQERRQRVELLASHAQVEIMLEEEVVVRGLELEKRGFSPYDALHIACAEAGGATVLLSTDDKFVRNAAKVAGDLRLRVLNPVDWLRGLEK